ncbi:MAG: hypothetical protein Fur0027_14410 [Raineya sp.]
MLRKYRLTGKSGTSCLLTYCDGKLCSIDFGDELITSEHFVWIAKYCFIEGELLEVAQKTQSKVTPCYDFAPTFEEFWRRYDYKFDRKRAEDKWNKLKDADKIAAIAYIEKYKNELRKTGVAQMYAKTYLQNQVWK